MLNWKENSKELSVKEHSKVGMQELKFSLMGRLMCLNAINLR